MIKAIAFDENGNVVLHDMKSSEQNPYKRMRDLEKERILKMTIIEFRDYLNNDNI